MKITGSPGRLRIAALVAVLAGGLSYAAMQGASGRSAVVLASVSLALFLLEVVLGILDGPKPPERR